MKFNFTTADFSLYPADEIRRQQNEHGRRMTRREAGVAEPDRAPRPRKRQVAGHVDEHGRSAMLKVLRNSGAANRRPDPSKEELLKAMAEAVQICNRGK